MYVVKGTLSGKNFVQLNLYNKLGFTCHIHILKINMENAMKLDIWALRIFYLLQTDDSTKNDSTLILSGILHLIVPEFHLN